MKKSYEALILRSALITVLSIFSITTEAKWIQIGENDRSIAYIDSSINRFGKTAIAWVLFDYKSVQESQLSSKRYLTEKAQWEIDCQGEKVRSLYVTWHSGHMGDGTVVYTGRKASEWDPTSAPNSYGNAFWKYSCSR